MASCIGRCFSGGSAWCVVKRIGMKFLAKEPTVCSAAAASGVRLDAKVPSGCTVGCLCARCESTSIVSPCSTCVRTSGCEVIAEPSVRAMPPKDAAASHAQEQ